MANITHTSTGATNTPRLLEVTGNTIALPLQDDMAFDFQIDHGIVMNESGNGGKWYSKVDPAMYMSGAVHTLDNTNQLADMPTLKFPPPIGQQYTQAYLGGVARFYPTWNNQSYKKIVMAVLFNESCPSGYNPIFSPNVWSGYWEGYLGRVEIGMYVSGGVRRVRFRVYHTGYSGYTNTTVDSEAISSGWHIAIWHLDMVNGLNTIWLDGQEIHDDTISTTFSGLSESNTDGGIGRNGNYGGARYTGNIAAAIGWKYTAPWTAAEFQSTHDYLMTKYGLT